MRRVCRRSGFAAATSLQSSVHGGRLYGSSPGGEGDGPKPKSPRETRRMVRQSILSGGQQQRMATSSNEEPAPESPKAEKQHESVATAQSRSTSSAGSSAPAAEEYVFRTSSSSQPEPVMGSGSDQLKSGKPLTAADFGAGTSVPSDTSQKRWEDTTIGSSAERSPQEVALLKGSKRDQVKSTRRMVDNRPGSARALTYLSSMMPGAQTRQTTEAADSDSSSSSVGKSKPGQRGVGQAASAEPHGRPLKLKKKDPWGQRQLKDSWSEDAMSRLENDNISERISREYRYDPFEPYRKYILPFGAAMFGSIVLASFVGYWLCTGKLLTSGDPMHFLALVRSYDTSPRSKYHSSKLFMEPKESYVMMKVRDSYPESDLAYSIYGEPEKSPERGGADPSADLGVA